MDIKENAEAWHEDSSKSITFIVTKDCQLACKYCYLVGKNEKERMPWEVAKQAICVRRVLCGILSAASPSSK